MGLEVKLSIDGRFFTRTKSVFRIKNTHALTGATPFAAVCSTAGAALVRCVPVRVPCSAHACESKR